MAIRFTSIISSNEESSDEVSEGTEELRDRQLEYLGWDVESVMLLPGNQKAAVRKQKMSLKQKIRICAKICFVVGLLTTIYYIYTM